MSGNSAYPICAGCGDPIQEQAGIWLAAFAGRGKDPGVCRARFKGHRPRGPRTIRDEMVQLRSHLAIGIEDDGREHKEADRRYDREAVARLSGRMSQAREVIDALDLLLAAYPAPAPFLEDDDDVIH